MSLQQETESDIISIGETHSDAEPHSLSEVASTAEVITEVEITDLQKEVERNIGPKLANVTVDILRPGDEQFDRIEIQHKLLVEKCGGDWDTFVEKYGFINQVPVEELKPAVAQEGVLLDGKLPGFVMVTEGSGRITFLMPPEEHASYLAEYYATQRQENLHFNTPQEATEYLRSLAREAYFHETGHNLLPKFKFGGQRKLG